MVEQVAKALAGTCREIQGGEVMLIKGKEGCTMASNGADMQAIRNRWLAKRQSQMAKWLNGFKPKAPKNKKDKDEKK